jgi:CHASE2 domain-containing sensor protein
LRRPGVGSDRPSAGVNRSSRCNASCASIREAAFASHVAILGLAIGFLTESELTRGLSFDALLTLRHAVFGDRHPTEKPQVVVVNVDENTFAAPGFVDVPLALWGPQFATVLDALDAADAETIGVDLIFAGTAEKVKPDHDRPLRATLHRLGSAERVVLAQTDIGGFIRLHKFFANLLSRTFNSKCADQPRWVIRYLPL